MKWNALQSEAALNNIVQASHERPQVIFKHSTTCPISSMAKMRLEEAWDMESVDVYYLDLLQYRKVSNAVADHLQVHHESPQVILIQDGEVTYDESHLDISVSEIKEAIAYTDKRKS